MHQGRDDNANGRLSRRSHRRLDRTGLTHAEVKHKIEEYLNKRGVKYRRNVAFGHKKKLNYVFENDHGETV